MKSFRTLALALVVSVISLSAHAQATRTWVSGVGDDVNPCSRTAPCKTFAGAISKTAAGGEISVLDPGGFGAVTIVKSITINGEGTLAGILAAGVPGVIINGAGIKVTLIDLKINGAGTGTHGVRVINAASVNIEDCQIWNFGTATSTGVNIENGAGINVKVRIGNTKIYNNGQFGIASRPTGGGTVSLTLDRVAVFNTAGSGVVLRQDTKATIGQSTFTGNAGAGVFAELSTAEANIYNSVMSNNFFGITNGNAGNPVTRVYGSQITNNTVHGILINSGSVLSHGNNAVQGNAGAQAFTGASIGTQ